MVTQYVVLLRGINVGGNNIIKMADLKACLEAAGFENVATYIQSGNVLLESPESDAAKLTDVLQKELSKTFKYDSRLVIRSHKQMKEIVAGAPKHFGDSVYRCDVIFLKPPLTPKKALGDFPLREEVDAVAPGKNVVYFSRVDARASHSLVSKVVAMPMYKNMTIRNWNTARKLLALMDARADAAKTAGK